MTAMEPQFVTFESRPRRSSSRRASSGRAALRRGRDAQPDRRSSRARSCRSTAIEHEQLGIVDPRRAGPRRRAASSTGSGPLDGLRRSPAGSSTPRTAGPEGALVLDVFQPVREDYRERWQRAGSELSLGVSRRGDLVAGLRDRRAARCMSLTPLSVAIARGARAAPFLTSRSCRRSRRRTRAPPFVEQLRAAALTAAGGVIFVELGRGVRAAGVWAFRRFVDDLRRRVASGSPSRV